MKAELRKHAGVVVVSDQAAGMEYLTWDGNVDNRVKQIAQIDKDFQLMSGLPSAVMDGTAGAAICTCVAVALAVFGICLVLDCLGLKL